MLVLWPDALLAAPLPDCPLAHARTAWRASPPAHHPSPHYCSLAQEEEDGEAEEGEEDGEQGEGEEDDIDYEDDDDEGMLDEL